MASNALLNDPHDPNRHQYAVNVLKQLKKYFTIIIQFININILNW